MLKSAGKEHNTLIICHVHVKVNSWSNMWFVHKKKDYQVLLFHLQFNLTFYF